jgi:hypothetical protein
MSGVGWLLVGLGIDWVLTGNYPFSASFFSDRALFVRVSLFFSFLSFINTTRLPKCMMMYVMTRQLIQLPSLLATTEKFFLSILTLCLCYTLRYNTVP